MFESSSKSRKRHLTQDTWQVQIWPQHRYTVEVYQKISQPVKNLVVAQSGSVRPARRSDVMDRARGGHVTQIYTTKKFFLEDG